MGIQFSKALLQQGFLWWGPAQFFTKASQMHIYPTIVPSQWLNFTTSSLISIETPKSPKNSRYTDLGTEMTSAFGGRYRVGLLSLRIPESFP